MAKKKTKQTNYKWTLGQLEQVSPYVIAIVGKIKDMEIDFETMGASDITALYFSMISEASKIIAITLEKPLEEVQKLNAEEAQEHINKIIEENRDVLNNMTGVFSAMMGVNIEDLPELDDSQE